MSPSIKPSTFACPLWDGCVYESREHRDAVNAKVMADPRLHSFFDPENPLFDCKRMACGGFKAIVELQKR